MRRRSFVLGVAATVVSTRFAMGTDKIPFDNFKVITHAKAWCGKKNNPCGKYFEGGSYSDCAHFVAHCLAAGGLTIKAPDPNFNPCPQGLAVRNTDLVPALRKLIAQGCSMWRKLV